MTDEVYSDKLTAEVYSGKSMYEHEAVVEMFEGAEE